MRPDSTAIAGPRFVVALFLGIAAFLGGLAWVAQSDGAPDPIGPVAAAQTRTPLPAPGQHLPPQRAYATLTPTVAAARRSGVGDPGKLDIVAINFGNFSDSSFDVFVDLANNTHAFYAFVSLDGVCRDDAGRVTGTGIANVSNLASGERTVATMTFVGVDPGECNATVSIGTAIP